jgi:hypothetical protein
MFSGDVYKSTWVKRGWCLPPKKGSDYTTGPNGPEKEIEPFSRGFAPAREKSWDAVLYNFEDCAMETVCCSYFLRNREEMLGYPEESYDVLILRDPFNMLASRMRHKKRLRMLGNSPAVAVELWKTYANEFIDPVWFDKDLIRINYNKWHTSLEYRNQMASLFNRNASDSVTNDVPRIGGGSSFDGVEKQGNAKSMKVLERWKSFKDNELYRSYLDDSDLWALSEYIFGHIPGTEYLRD